MFLLKLYKVQLKWAETDFFENFYLRLKISFFQ